MWTSWIVSALLSAHAEPAAPRAAPAPVPVAEGEEGRASASEFDLSRLDDPGDWHRRARVLVDGPEGCIEVQGRVRLQISLYSAGGMWSAGGRADVVAQGRFEGRLDNGVWTRLDMSWDPRPEGADISLEVSRFRPVVGRLPEVEYRPEDARAFREDIESRYENPEFYGVEEEGSSAGEGSLALTQDEDGLHLFLDVGGSETLSMLDEVIQGLDPSGTSTYVTWDREQRVVEMTEAVPMENGGSLAIAVQFPDGGAPTRLDATFPKKVHFRENGFRVTIRDAQMHIRSKETPLGVVPGVEGMSAVIGALGFTLGLDQRVSYDRVRACGGG